jgi:D-aminopeptidase
MGFKAGIGTSSRLVSLPRGAVTIGALVQSNFGGVLTVRGVPVRPPDRPQGPEPAGNSCVTVIATDGRLDARQLERVARRAFAGMARAGSDFSGRSGDYALAVSTASEQGPGSGSEPVPDNDLDLIFTAAIEATEEAILNSLFMAVTTAGFDGHVRQAVSLDYVQDLVSGRAAAQSGS